MKVSIDDLKKRYETLDTDELLALKVNGGLTEEAEVLLKAELGKRGEEISENFAELDKRGETITQNFIDVLLQYSEALGMERSKNVDIPADKYLLLQEFVQFLVFNCYSSVNAKLCHERIKDTQWLELFWQYLYFFIHLTDRMAISTLSDLDRHSLMQEIGEFAISLALLTLYPREENFLLFEQAMGGLNMAASEYSHFQKISPEANEGPKDTLLWEFSKKVNKILGQETKLGALIGEEYAIVTLLKNLNIQSFLNKWVAPVHS